MFSQNLDNIKRTIHMVFRNSLYLSLWNRSFMPASSRSVSSLVRSKLVGFAWVSGISILLIRFVKTCARRVAFVLAIAYNNCEVFCNG